MVPPAPTYLDREFFAGTSGPDGQGPLQQRTRCSNRRSTRSVCPARGNDESHVCRFKSCFSLLELDDLARALLVTPDQRFFKRSLGLLQLPVPMRADFVVHPKRGGFIDRNHHRFPLETAVEEMLDDIARHHVKALFSRQDPVLPRHVRASLRSWSSFNSAKLRDSSDKAILAGAINETGFSASFSFRLLRRPPVFHGHSWHPGLNWVDSIEAWKDFLTFGWKGQSNSTYSSCTRWNRPARRSGPTDHR